jgi:hypothetical protein
MEIKDASDLLKLAAFRAQLYEPLSLATLTAYSVYWLSQWGLQPSLENLAILNFKLFPSKFAMVGWPKFPDANRTNRSVLQMRPKYRNFATSIASEGIFLNDRGIAEAQSLLNRLGPPQFQDGSSAPTQFPLRSVWRGRARTVPTPLELVEEIRKSQLFRMFESGRWAEVEAIDLIQFLGVYDHTPSKEKRARLRQYQSAAKEVKDAVVERFLNQIVSTFGPYLQK